MKQVAVDTRVQVFSSHLSWEFIWEKCVVTGWGTLSFGRLWKYTPPAEGDPAWLCVATLAPITPPWCSCFTSEVWFQFTFP